MEIFAQLGTAELLTDLLSGSLNSSISEIGWISFIVVMFVSLIYSLLIAWLYNLFYAKNNPGSTMHRAFPLLGVSVTAIFIFIQFSLPLSLGLLGALSIVRFRNPVKDAEEIGYVMFLIAGAIACGVFNIAFLGLVLLIGVVAIVANSFLGKSARAARGAGTLVASFTEKPDSNQKEAVVTAVKEVLPNAMLDALSCNGSEQQMTFMFSKLSSENALALEKKVSEAIPGGAIHIFYSRAEQLV